MPYNRRQAAMAGAELGRMRAGKKTRTGMSEAQLRKMASRHEGEAMKRKAKKA